MDGAHIKMGIKLFNHISFEAISEDTYPAIAIFPSPTAI